MSKFVHMELNTSDVKGAKAFYKGVFGWKIKDMKMPFITVNGPRSYSGSLFKSYYADTTPMIYIVDSKRKIIGKGLPVDRIEDFIVNYEKFERRKAAMQAKKQGAGK